MTKKKYPLAEGEVYHIFSKSIAGFEIFRQNSEYNRMKNVLSYYKLEKPSLRFSMFMEIKNKEKLFQKHFSEKRNLIDIVAYCLMPTHIHLVLKQLVANGISIFMNNILNSYTRYFNVKTKRKGPLWESRFQRVLVKSDEHLLHLTRYIHLNPVTVHLVDKPQDWQFSSYKEFFGKAEERICNFSQLLEIKPVDYRKFVDSQINYQRELAEIKQLFVE